MKIPIKILDSIILGLLSYIVLVDMINGYFIMEDSRLPISQVYKLIILILMLLRMSISKEIILAIFLIFLFEINAFFGFINHRDLSDFSKDLVFGAKWVNVPISYFYFKNLFLSNHFDLIFDKFRKMIRWNFLFICLNMFLGVLGFGMAFYFDGYPNAIGTKGFIFAGNELTILVLSIYFIINVHFYFLKQYRNYFFFFLIFILLSFLITSKTVLFGVFLVFIIPLITSIGQRIKKIWISRLVKVFMFAFPVFIVLIYFGIANSGVINKISYSLRANNNDILTVILSNRNNFVAEGWRVFNEHYSFFQRVFGMGQQYHLKFSGHSAEVDFFSLLFAAGYIGLFSLLFVIFYWFYNVSFCLKRPEYIFARNCAAFIVFLLIISNLAGHVLGSGIAGIFIGICLALMYFNKSVYEDSNQFA